MPTWPAALPWPPNGNKGKWKETPPETVVRDENEVGPATVRRRAVAAVRKLELPFCFNAVQTDIFDAWLRDDLHDGALAFTQTWPPPPRSSQSVEMRIISPVTYEHQGGGAYNVTLNVEVLP